MTAARTPTTSADAALPFARWRRAGRLVLLALILFGAAAAWRWRALLDPAAIAKAIGGSSAAPLLFLAAQMAASLVFLPRTLLAIAAGLLFGMWWGLLWAALGSVAGAVAGFLAVRYLNSGLVDVATLPRIGPLLGSIGRGGWRAVAALRLVPVVPHSLANYALGLTRVTLRAYAVGSLVGQLPMTLACVELGAAGQRLMIGEQAWLTPTLIGLSALALSLLIPAFARRRAGS